jgi:hypothetical protein
MLVEVVGTLVQPYPMLYDKTYYESANENSAGIPFQWNDFLLCYAMFFRVQFLFRSVVVIS